VDHPDVRRMLVFACFSADVHVPAVAGPEVLRRVTPDTEYPVSALCEYVILLKSPCCVVTAIRAIRSSQVWRPDGFWRRACVRLAFVGLKVVEYTAQGHEGHTPTDAFYLYYFIITGLPCFHSSSES